MMNYDLSIGNFSTKLNFCLYCTKGWLVQDPLPNDVHQRKYETLSTCDGSCTRNCKRVDAEEYVEQIIWNSCAHEKQSSFGHLRTS